MKVIWGGKRLDFCVLVKNKMSALSGVISRQVVPACDNLCFFCPALRTRSRQPVKRYKHLISDIFPRSQVSFYEESYGVCVSE